MIRDIHKIALINPDNPINKANPELSEMFERNSKHVKQWAAPALSLLTIAALIPESIEVEYIDERYEEIDFDKNYDLVGLTSMTHQVVRAYKIAKIFKEKGIPVVMGGIHASILPEEALQHVDTVFVGESENLWPKYLNDFKHFKEKRLYENKDVIELTQSPVPRYELIKHDLFKNMDNYFNFIPVQATRGCPHDCSFCVATKYYGKRIRKKEVDQVVKEIEHLRKFNQESLIFFADDNLFVDKKYVKSLLHALIPLKLKYFAQTDVKFADDEELLELAYLSGFEMVFIGFESINLESLDEINKNKWKMNQSKNYSSAIKKIQAHGIVPFGGFIIGFHHDTLNTFKAISEFVVQNNFPAAFTLLTPLPGSRLRDELQSEGRLFEMGSWDKCGFYSLLFKHDSMSKIDAEKALVKLYEDVYTTENALQRAFHMKKMYKNLPKRWSYKPVSP